MKFRNKSLATPLAILTALLALASCQTVSETGRSQVAWFPSSYLSEMSLAAYDEETGKYPLVTSGRDYEMLQRLGRRIAQASGRDYDWEFRLLQAPDVVNAFALPGGKVAVYTGILKVTQTEDALAAVVGHEVAHVTASHGNERMTQNAIAAGMLTAGELALDSYTELDPTERALAVSALGFASQAAVLLPYSRTHESEADEIGLRYLVRAGYDPNQAPALWERMAQLGGGGQKGFIENMLATHPDPLDRAERLRELIPRIVAEEGGR